MPQARVNAQTPWFVKNVINPMMLLTGGVPTLTVRGRRTGKSIRIPINVVSIGDAVFMVSPRGETSWSRNLRVVGECSLKMKGAERRYRATEVEPQERTPIIAAYLE